MKVPGLLPPLCFIVIFSAAKKSDQHFSATELTKAGVCYYPGHRDELPCERDLKKMTEMGFEFTRVAEFAWAQLEPEARRFDFAWKERNSCHRRLGLEAVNRI